MRGKINIRYIDFTPSRNGNRVFHFAIRTQPMVEELASVEMPQEFLVGDNRIPFQDCAGISYAKLQHLVEIEGSDLPRNLCLTASDIFEFRKPLREQSAAAHGYRKRA